MFELDPMIPEIPELPLSKKNKSLRALRTQKDAIAMRLPGIPRYGAAGSMTGYNHKQWKQLLYANDIDCI